MGDIVLVCVEADLWRPLIVSAVTTRVPTTPVGSPIAPPGERETRVSGTLFCEPDDYSRLIFRGALDRRDDPARIEGRPSGMIPVAYGRFLAEGPGLGQWRRR